MREESSARKRPDEERNVLRALAQRRHADREDGEAVVEVAAEAPLADLFAEVAIRRRDDAHVHLDRPRAAEALELAGLEDAQELRLQLERQLADLVEEEGRAVGDLEAPDLAGQGAGEGALLAPEQLALDQARRQRRAVDLDHDVPRCAGSCGGWRAPRAPCRCRSRPARARRSPSARPAPPAAGRSGWRGSGR